MRSLKRAVLGAVIAAFPLFAHADKLVTKLRVSVDTFAIRKIDRDTPTSVVFTDSAIKGEVALVAALLPSSEPGASAIGLPSSEWWKHLTWKLVRKGGETPPFHPQWTSTDRAGDRSVRVTTDRPPELRAGDRLIARFSAGQLPPGEYRLSVRLGDLQSESEWFLVSNGQENEDLRREFARYKVDRSPDKASLRTNLLELAAADPLNASPWIRLGDLALSEGSAEEIRGYYDRAVEVLDKRRQKYAAEGRQEVVAAIQADRQMIVAVRDLVSNYVANRGTLVLHADVQGGRRYVLRERASGRVIRTIAPSRETDRK